MTKNEDLKALGAAYKRYPDLVLDECSPEDVIKMFEMAVLLNTEYTQKSFVHKMLLQGAYSLRQALTSPTVTPNDGDAERALEALDIICKSKCDALWYEEEIKTIRTALQSTRKQKG